MVQIDEFLTLELYLFSQRGVKLPRGIFARELQVRGLVLFSARIDGIAAKSLPENRDLTPSRCL